MRSEERRRRKNRRIYTMLIVMILSLCLNLFFIIHYLSARKSNADNKDKINTEEKINRNVSEKKDISEKSDNKNNKNEGDKTKDDEKKDKKDENNNPDETSLNKGKSYKESAEAYAYDTKEVRENLENSDYKGKKLAFLTFDDGVNNTITPRVLDTLKEKKVHATFFVVGNNIGENTKGNLKRIYDEGHSIGIHSYYHNYDILYPNGIAKPDVILQEYKDTVEEIRKQLGDDFDSKIWRYPGGHMSWDKESLAKADKALADLGVQWIDWNSMNGDAQPTHSDYENDILRPTNTQEVISNFDRSLDFTSNSNQIVILMHDAENKEVTANALPDLIDHIRSLGYEFGILK